MGKGSESDDSNSDGISSTDDESWIKDAANPINKPARRSHRKNKLSFYGTYLLDDVLKAGLGVESDASNVQYRLERLVGRGSFGRVWLCKDSEHQGNRAIKIVAVNGAATLASEMEKTRRASDAAGAKHVPKFYEAASGKIVD